MSEVCPLCGAPLHPEQEWCLRCGAAARTRLSASPNWKAPIVVLAVLAALSLGVLAAALVKLAGSSGTTARPATSTVTTAPAAITPAPTAATPGASTPGAAGTSTPGAAAPLGTATGRAAPPASATPGGVGSSKSRALISPGTGTANTKAPAVNPVRKSLERLGLLGRSRSK